MRIQYLQQFQRRSSRWQTKIERRGGTVTLCMAAICEHNGEPRIVICADWLTRTEGVGSSDRTDKTRDLPHGWTALLAGTISSADALANEYEAELLQVKGALASDRDLLDTMRRPVEKRRQTLADEFTSRAVAMRYADFVASKLPSDFIEKKLLEMEARIKLDAQLLIVGFTKTGGTEGDSPSPYIFRVDDTSVETVTWERDYAAIGSGAFIASSALYQRQLSSESSLMETIYALWEAHTLAEAEPTVGGSRTIDIFCYDKPVETLSDAGARRCEKLYARFGPKLDLDKKQQKMMASWQDSFAEPVEPESASAASA